MTRYPVYFGKPIVRDYSHCPMIEAMYFAMFGLREGKYDLFKEEDEFPKLIYVATQREEVPKVESSESRTKEGEKSLK